MLNVFFAIFSPRTIVGKENIASTGPVILAPNHRSYIDTPLLAIAPDRHRDLWFMAKSSIFLNVHFSRFFFICGSFPVERERSDRNSLKYALNVLDRGDLLAIYPEGGRRSGSTVEEIMQGALWIAAKSGAPVVPVGIGGSEKLLPPEKFFPRRTKTAIVFGEPVTFNELAGRNPEDRSRAKRTELQIAGEQLKVRIQEVFDEAERLRK